MRIIIAGGGPAAVEAAITIRQYDKTSRIDLFSAENVLPYRRTLLPKLLAKEIIREHLTVHPADFYTENNINIHLGERVMSIDPSGQHVILHNNETVPYDRLLLAVGRKSRQIVVSPEVQNRVLSLHDIQDVEKIESLLNQVADITVVGGGILGLECADALLKRNFHVNIIEQNSTLMHGLLDDDSAVFLQKQLFGYNKKLTIYPECTLRQAVRQNNKTVCYLSNPHNKVIYTDLIISAIGLEAGQNWGFELEANYLMQIKNCKNIFGAGDCISLNGQTNTFYKSALMQGKIAGANIAGQHQKYILQPSECRSMFNNIPFYRAGITDLAITECLSEYNNNALKKLFYQQNKLVGCVLIGNTQDAGELYSIIRKNPIPKNQHLR